MTITAPPAVTGAAQRRRSRPVPGTTRRLASVDLFWLPLGAGDAPAAVRWSGRAYEAIAAAHQLRPRRSLFHSALQVRCDGELFVIEMAPVWSGARSEDRGVVLEGPVGLASLGAFRLFRYEVRRWRDGVIPDVEAAVGGPHHLSSDRYLAERLLKLVPEFPAATWGRDEQDTGEMWNSNSLISWLLGRSGHDVSRVTLPTNGRAPGWSAGSVVAVRDQRAAVRRTTPSWPSETSRFLPPHLAT